MSKKSKGHYIAGQWIKSNGNSFESLNPSTGNVIWVGNSATTNEINSAIGQANLAFNEWAKKEISERINYLESFVEVLKEHKDLISNSISEEIGKPLWESATEVGAMIGKIVPTLQAYKDRCIETVRDLPNGKSKTKFRPHGVAVVIGPYNFPGHMPNGQILPALLAGNTVILKPSEYAPATSELIIECWQKAKLPKGVINLLQGDSSVGKELCLHNDTNAVFFTGSRKAGNSIRSNTSVDKMCALEMGGNSPLIVWDSSDIDAAVFATIQSAYITTGQRCSSARRLIIPNNDFGDNFISRLAKVTKELKVGVYNESPEPYMGPLRHPQMVNNLIDFQNKLSANGANILLECKALSLGESFVTPGIIDVSNVKNRIDEEVIGPLLQVCRTDKFEDAIRIANDTKYGLAAGIFTEDEELFQKFEFSIKAGIINWNQQLTGASPWAPFGGIKSSGNFRPAGYFATDFCVYSTGLIELEKLEMPSSLPSGLTF